MRQVPPPKAFSSLNLALVCVVFLPACASGPGPSDGNDLGIVSTISFVQLQAAPDTFRGKTVVFGGEVLVAKRLKEGTQIEVLHLPLGNNDQPGTDRMDSQGRFLALQKEFLDPAILPPGTRITVTGEVIGSTTLPLDDTEYHYPTLSITHLRVWPEEEPYHSYWRYPSYWAPYWEPSWYRHH